jgi:hypothetical protein
MKNEILAQPLVPTNRKIIIGLILIMLLMVVTTVAGFYSFYSTNNKAIRYFHTLKDIKDIKAIYQEQIGIWRSMAAHKEDDRVLHDAYYKFSKKADIIQDKYFNLRMKFLDDKDNHTAEKIEKIKSFHQKTSEKYISVIFEAPASVLPYDQSVLMRDDEAKIFEDLDYISKVIMGMVSTEIGKTTNYYYFMLAAFVIIIILLSAILIVIMIKGKKRKTAVYHQ